jgi:hypothetical protein
MRNALLVAVLVACNSGSSPSPDTSTHGTLGFGSACTTVSDTSTECASGVCTNSVNMAATPLCSVKCTMPGSGSDAECPAGSMGQKCNAMGYCRP